MPAKLTFSGDVRKFEGFVNSRVWLKYLKEEVGKATAKNCAYILAEVEKKIERGVKPKNAKLTELLKGKDSPLIDTSDMLRALESHLQDSFNAKVGFLRNMKTSHGRSLRLVVPKLEKGFTIRVTPRMRNWMLQNMPLSAFTPGVKGKGRIVIPPRPFLTPVFESPIVRKKVNDNWEEAVRRSLQRMGAL